MITLTAKMKIQCANPRPFKVGESAIGFGDLIGNEINADVDLNQSNLLSLESEIFDRGDTEVPSWGIISNGCQISFNDRNYRFKGYAEAGLLNNGVRCDIFLEDNIKKTKNNVGTYYTSDWDYNSNNRSVSLSLKDGLEEWQDISVDGIDYDPRNPQSQTMEWFYRQIYAKTPSKYNMRQFDFLDDKTKSVLSNTNVKFPMLESGSLWSQWTKLCECCGLYIYSYNGETICKYYGG